MTKISHLMVAVATVCAGSAALAQSSVELYGRVNTSIEQQKLGQQKTTGVVSNSSFLGLRGTEDLGAGLKAGFVLESSFGADTGAGGSAEGGLNFERNSELNLSGNFGMVRVGQFDPYSYSVTADFISMHNHDTGASADKLYKINPAAGNILAYRTPTVGGVTAELQYHFGEKQVDSDGLQDRGAIDLGVDYAQGPLGLGLGYYRAKKSHAIDGARHIEQLGARVSYAIGDLTLGGYAQRFEVKQAGAKQYAGNTYRLAAMYTLGASELHANVGRATATQQSESATQWTLAYNYNLSKRTKVYALYSSINHAAASNIEGGSFDFTPAVHGDNAKFRTLGVGVRHLF